MNSIVALGAVTVGINLTVSQTELYELGITPGDCLCLSVEQIEAFRLALSFGSESEAAMSRWQVRQWLKTTVLFTIPLAQKLK